MLSLVFLSSAYGSKEDASEHGNRGVALYQQGQVAESFAELKLAIEADPKNSAWHMNYGSFMFDQSRVYYYREGRSERTLSLARDAQAELEQATKLMSEKEWQPNAHCHYLLGDIQAFIFEDLSKALEEYNKALKIDPENRDAKNGLATVQKIASIKGKKRTHDGLGAAKSSSEPATDLPAPAGPSGPKIVLKQKLILKNGTRLDVNILEQSSKGLWAELDEGTKVYFSSAEIQEIKK